MYNAHKAVIIYDENKVVLHSADIDWTEDYDFDKELTSEAECIWNIKTLTRVAQELLLDAIREHDLYKARIAELVLENIESADYYVTDTEIEMFVDSEYLS